MDDLRMIRSIEQLRERIGWNNGVTETDLAVVREIGLRHSIVPNPSYSISRYC